MLRERKTVYTVQDVIEAVQNGGSDFEMESETSESSDEELDKQNQAPIDCPTTDDEEVEATKPSQTTYRTTPRDQYRWLKKDFTSPCTNFSGPDVTSGAVNPHTPLEYFQRFVSEDMIQSLTENTNVYSLQKNSTCLNTSDKEIEQMIGMYLKMGLMQMSGVRMYWETDTRYTPVSDVMSRNRFQSLLASLHFVNNLTVSEAQKKDKLWKLRPWLASFREKCLLVVPEEHNSVGEMMVPFKGKFSGIKQYMRSKPHPWGFKLWVRTGSSGILCDFDVYQGSIDGRQARSELGMSGDVVMKLVSTLPDGQNYKIYADNYFTSVPLVVRLLDHGMHFVGTARQVRLPNCSLEDEKSLKKKGRGSFDVRVEGNHNICAVRWYDNRVVTLVSSFAGPEPVTKIQRWNNATKSYTEVERPYIVDAYNKHMGGVDLLDSFAAKYKFPMKSHRWYIYIFWHTIILAVINAWLLYKRDCKACKIPKKEILNRRAFQGQLASSLILVNSIPQKPKRERPSLGGGSPVSPVTSRSPLTSMTVIPQRSVSAQGRLCVPPVDVRKDMIAHFPVKSKRGRCRHCDKGYTNTLCRKCGIRLCFSEERNCFLEFHCT